MKVIPEEIRYARKCYFCGRSHLPANPVEFQLDVQETKIPEEERKFLGEGVYCCRECLEKEWMAK